MMETVKELQLSMPFRLAPTTPSSLGLLQEIVPIDSIGSLRGRIEVSSIRLLSWAAQSLTTTISSDMALSVAFNFTSGKA